MNTDKRGWENVGVEKNEKSRLGEQNREWRGID